MPSSIAVDHRPSSSYSNGHANGHAHAHGHGQKRKHSHMNGNSTSTNGGTPTISSTAALHEILMNPLRFDRSVMNPAQIKYKPINEPHTPKPTDPATSTANGDSPTKKSKSASSSTSPELLFSGKIPLAWPGGTKNVGSGLHNRGNTCYMNSVMQSLIHTAPLTHLLLSNDLNLLKGRAGGEIRGFDSVKAMQSLVRRAAGSSPSVGVTSPMEFIKNLKSISKTFSHGRQEDAHEWLRFLLDNMHQSCIVQLSSKAKISSPLRETTFIHRTFAGKLRSRVTCLSCKHNSDTYETMLDLSLDIRKSNTLRDALDLFTEQDELRGSEKYKCEKCKRLSNAIKYYRIASCPPVLTIHLKRFTFTGSKNNKPFTFPTTLKLSKSCLTSSSHSDEITYSLYAIVHHFGSGPHSGHYVAEVKAKNGQWYTMNDDSVSSTSTPGGAPSKSAYILFYVRNGGDSLQDVLKHTKMKVKEEVEEESDPEESKPNGHVQSSKKSANQFSIQKSSSSSRFNTSNGPKPHSSILTPINPSSFHSSNQGGMGIMMEEDTGQSIDPDDSRGSIVSEGGDPISRKLKRKQLKQQQQQQFSSSKNGNGFSGGSFAKRMKGRKTH